MNRTVIGLTWAFVAMAAATLTAQDRFDPAAAAKAVAPYLDEQTIAVAEADLRRIDFDAGRNFIAELMGAGPNEQAQLQQPAKAIAEWAGRLQQAGGGELFVAISLADFPNAPPLLVAPVAPQGNPDQVAELLQQFVRTPHWKVQKARGAVLAGSPAALERIASQPPAARPNLTPALAATGNAPVRLVVVPSDDMRRVLQEMLPPLPAELGGASGRQLADGLLWLAASLQPPPDLEARIVSQAANAEAAAKLRETLVAAVPKLAQAAQKNGLVENPEKLAAALTPQVEGHQVIVSLDRAGASQLAESVLAPAFGAARETARRKQTQNNLKQLALAIHNYHGVTNHFPAAGSANAAGQKLLSWRVHLLPYLGQNDLYRQFHLDEPWDSPHNRTLIAKTPAVFASPNLSSQARSEGKTTYLAPIAPGAIFGGDQPTTFGQIADGSSNTILLLEAKPSAAVVWTKPEDLSVDLDAPLQGLTGQAIRGFHAVLADGSVRFISESVDPQVLRRLFLMNDGEVVELP
jgi:hypothetical protein